MADLIQIRRDNASNWTGVNPTLALGELGLVMGSNGQFSGLYKVGNGSTNWNSLPAYYAVKGTGENSGQLIGFGSDGTPVSLGVTIADVTSSIVDSIQDLSSSVGSISSSINTRIVSITGSLTTLSSSVDLISGSINTRINTISGSVTALSSSVNTTISSSINNLSSSLNSLSGSVSKSISELSGSMNTVISGTFVQMSESIADLAEDIDQNYAKQDGFYETLGAGVAANLVGHGTVPAEYTFRTSGGNEDLGTGNASINVMKGKTLKWQQMIAKDAVSSTTTYNVTFTNNSNGSWTISSTGAAAGAYFFITDFISIIEGHNYYIAGGSGNVRFGGYYSSRISSTSSKSIVTASSSGGDKLAFIISSGWSGTITVWPQLIDLTEMFGASNEPSTVAEFEALYPLDYYPYIATPVLINNTASGIKTTGFNQWDEEWENGIYKSSDGQPDNTYPNNLRCKNAIKVFPGVTYYIKTTRNIKLLFYDVNDTFISATGADYLNTTVIIPPNCYHLRFNTDSQYGTGVYNHDICINLSWSGYRNGEYEPYEEHTLYFDTVSGSSGSLATLTGKVLDASGLVSGSSEVIFPEGLKNVGTIYDEFSSYENGYLTKAVKRLGAVDLGSLDWTAMTYNRFSSTVISDIKSASGSQIANIICALYKTVAKNSVESADKQISVDAKSIVLCNTSYLTADALKTALNGVKLYYELATPEEYLLDTPIPANYYVNDFGTEERLPQDTSGSVAAPILYDVKYAMNAVDTIRRLPVNYISAGSMTNFTAELASKLGAFLSASIAISSSYDATDQEYDYSITIIPNA